MYVMRQGKVAWCRLMEGGLHLIGAVILFITFTACASSHGGADAGMSDGADVDDGATSRGDVGDSDTTEVNPDGTLDGSDVGGPTDADAPFVDRGTDEGRPDSFDYGRAGQSCTVSEFDAGCYCVEGSRDSGVCVLDERSRGWRGPCSFGQCPAAQGLYCLTQYLPGGATTYLGCNPNVVCDALRTTPVRPPTSDRFVECRYSDGTPYERGAIPEASCPAGSSGLVCGSSCSPCSFCWAISERFPLGYCATDEAGSCARRSDCPDFPEMLSGDPYVCILPTNLDGSGLRPRGLCTARGRCRRVSQLLPARFQCDE
jgi:hypothetical protein